MRAVRRAGYELVDRYDAIDVLINNTGVNDTRSKPTADGFDHMMASNYLGPFLLTRLVLERVKQPRRRASWWSARRHIGWRARSTRHASRSSAATAR